MRKAASFIILWTALEPGLTSRHLFKVQLGHSHCPKMTRVVVTPIISMAPVLGELALLSSVQGQCLLALQGLLVVCSRLQQQNGVHATALLTIVEWSVMVILSL